MTRPAVPGKPVLLWDLDGTLVEWTSPWVIPYIAWRHWRVLGARHGWLRFPWAAARAYAAMLRSPGGRPLREVYLGGLSRALGLPEETLEAEELELVEGLGGLAAWIRPVPEGQALFRRLAASGRYRMVAATNPTMPQRFNELRLGWAGYDPGAFELVTGTEVASRLKSSPRFYADLLERLEVPAACCRMIGNDGRKDLTAAALGIPVFMLTCGREKNLDAWPGLVPEGRGDYRDLEAWLEEPEVAGPGAR